MVPELATLELVWDHVLINDPVTVRLTVSACAVNLAGCPQQISLITLIIMLPEHSATAT